MRQPADTHQAQGNQTTQNAGRPTITAGQRHKRVGETPWPAPQRHSKGTISPSYDLKTSGSAAGKVCWEGAMR